MENIPKLKTSIVLSAKQDVGGTKTPLKMPGAPHQKPGNRSDPSVAQVWLEAMQEARTERGAAVVLLMMMLVHGRTASC